MNGVPLVQDPANSIEGRVVLMVSIGSALPILRKISYKFNMIATVV